MQKCIEERGREKWRWEGRKERRRWERSREERGGDGIGIERRKGVE